MSENGESRRDPGPPRGARDPGPPRGARDPGPPQGVRDTGPPEGVRDAGPPAGVRDAGPPRGKEGSAGVPPEPGRTSSPPAGGRDPGPPGGVGGGDAGQAPRLDLATLLYFKPYFVAQRSRLLAILALLCFGGALPVVMGFFPKVLGENWQVGRESIVIGWIAAFLALGLIAIALSTVQTYLTVRVAQDLAATLKGAIFRKVGALSKSAMAFRSVGSLAHRSSGDVAHMQEFLARFVPEAIASVIQIVLVTLAILWLQPAVALVGLVLVPAIWLLMERINRRVRGLARSSQQQSESALTRLIEGVAGYIDLVAAGRFSRAADEYDAALDGLRRTAIRTTLTSALAALIPSLAFMAITFGYYFFVVGEQQVLGDVAALGEIMTFVGLLSVARMPLMSLARFLTEAAVAAPSFHEVRRLLEAPEVIEPSRGAEIGGSAIEFKDVSFAYGPQFPKILDGVDFTVPEGSFTAVVGETGSGKTTLFHLLLRLLEPGDGEIRIGGTPLRDVSLEDLRSHVGFIPQSPFLFDATIRENVAIALPKGEVDSGAMARAVEMAQLAPVIEKRAAQGGLDAPVGAGGASLSGGERQRVALARVFLRDPRVIVCDEYTANIDNATARLIHEALAKAFAGRTRIVITHQLYTIRGADQILVLEHGRIAERGSHEELLAKGGLYREMWEVQRLS